MNIYYIVVVVTLLVQLFPFNGDKSYVKKLVLSFVPLFLFGALRDNFGYDYIEYQTTFINIHQFGINSVEHAELGYRILCKVLPSFRCLIIVQSLLVCYAYGVFFYRYVPQKYTFFVFVLLFLSGQYTVFFMFSGIRNAIAISILILTIPLMEKKNWKACLVLTILASLFHTSAVLVMPIVFVVCSNKKMSKFEYKIWLISMIALLVIPIDTIFGQAGLFFDMYMDRYSAYTTHAMEMEHERSILVLSSTTIMSLATLLYARQSQDKTGLLLARLALLCLYANYLGTLNMRITNYLQFFYIVFLAYLIPMWNNKNIIKYPFTILAVAYMAYAFFIVFIGNDTFIYQEYYSIFNH